MIQLSRCSSGYLERAVVPNLFRPTDHLFLKISDEPLCNAVTSSTTTSPTCIVHWSVNVSSRIYGIPVVHLNHAAKHWSIVTPQCALLTTLSLTSRRDITSCTDIRPPRTSRAAPRPSSTGALRPSAPARSKRKKPPELCAKVRAHCDARIGRVVTWRCLIGRSLTSCGG